MSRVNQVAELLSAISTVIPDFFRIHRDPPLIRDRKVFQPIYCFNKLLLLFDLPRRALVSEKPFPKGRRGRS